MSYRATRQRRRRAHVATFRHRRKVQPLAADEGAGSLATGAGAGGTGVTVAGPGETRGVTFVWLLAVQKTAAIATRTTPPSKAHNQRDMAFPSRRLELSPMMGDPHPSVESVGRVVARRDIRRRQSVMART